MYALSHMNEVSSDQHETVA